MMTVGRFSANLSLLLIVFMPFHTWQGHGQKRMLIHGERCIIYNHNILLFLTIALFTYGLSFLKANSGLNVVNYLLLFRIGKLIIQVDCKTGCL